MKIFLTPNPAFDGYPKALAVPRFMIMLQDTTPIVGSEIYRVFNNNNEYVGWVTPKEARSYIYSQMYYRTGREYLAKIIKQKKKEAQVNPLTGWTITDRKQHTLCLVFLKLVVTDWDLIDPTRIEDLAEYHYKSLTAQLPLDNDPVCFPILDDKQHVIRSKYQEDLAEVTLQYQSNWRQLRIAANNQQLAVVKDIRDAKRVLANAKKKHNINLDI